VTTRTSTTQQAVHQGTARLYPGLMSDVTRIKVQVREALPGRWEYRLLHPNGDVARESKPDYFASEQEARAAAADARRFLAHDDSWRD